MIKVEDIEFKYGNSALKLESISDGDEKKKTEYSYVKEFSLSVKSLELGESESLAITGVSGSGKSTFLRLISGELLIQSGKITVLGKELHQMRDSTRRSFRLESLGMIFQDSPLLDYLTIRDNILLPARIAGKSDLLDIKELSANCGIEDLLDRYPKKLSEGEKQRAAICRALVSSPKLVLADEPTSSLDPARSSEITDLLIENCKKYKCSLVMVTHDYSLLDKFDKTVDISKLGEAND